MSYSMISSSDRAAAIQSIVEGVRFDGRDRMAGREVSIKFEEDYGRVEVCLGKTRVLCVVTAEITEPQPNRPNDGQLQFHVEFGPLANPKFQMSRDSQNTAAATDVVVLIERMLRGSRAIDTEALCIIGGVKVWSVRCDVRALNDDGNMRDACALAALCGLMHYKHEDVDVSIVDDGSSKKLVTKTEQEPVPLSIHHTPMLVSFALGDDGSLVLDPSAVEETVAQGFISVAVNQFGELCGLHKPGGAAVSHSKVLECVAVACTRAKRLCELVEEAKEQFQVEREKRRKNVHQRYQTAPVSA